jgi:hypothetical protein
MLEHMHGQLIAILDHDDGLHVTLACVSLMKTRCRSAPQLINSSKLLGLEMLLYMSFDHELQARGSVACSFFC